GEPPSFAVRSSRWLLPRRGHPLRLAFVLLAMDLHVDLRSKHGYLLRRLNAYPYLLPGDRQDRYLNIVADHDALVGLTRQNQHFGAPSFLASTTGATPRVPALVSSIVLYRAERRPVPQRFGIELDV